MWPMFKEYMQIDLAPRNYGRDKLSIIKIV